ncbi:MAG: 16S rRNA (guanine(527)-N(7))-methyltransferase RsmG [Spirochaetota bacterium]
MRDTPLAAEARRELLATGLSRLGYAPTDDQLARLLRYVDEIELWNPRLKLVGASGRELIVRHVLDCVAGAAALRASEGSSAALHGAQAARASGPSLPATVADMGSGAGLPGIPIAIMHPETKVDLVERSGRRAGFLRNAVAAARVENASVLNTEAERYGRRVDLVVHRAFLPLTRGLLAVLRRSLVPGGAVCAYKGRREAMDAELEQLDGEDAPEIEVVPVSVPYLEEERHLVVMRWLTPA